MNNPHLFSINSGPCTPVASNLPSLVTVNQTFSKVYTHEIASHLRCRFMISIADILGKLWASPYTLLGLTYGLAADPISLLLGAPARICIGNNAIQFIDNRGIVRGAALTLGNVILYGVGADPSCAGAYGDARVNLGRHEEAHTRQYQLLGLFFVPVYLLCNLRGTRRNPLERAAQHYGAGRPEWWHWVNAS